MTKAIYPRGSVWRKWDLQIHTPYSVLCNQFGSNFDEYIKKLFKKAIEKNIAVIGITDYFTIEGYKKVKEYLSDPTKLNSLFSQDEILKIEKILILPNVEFRLFPLNGNRINFHVIFSDDTPIKEIEENFLHNLHFVREGAPFETDEKRKLKIINIEELGKKLKEEHAPFRAMTDLYVGMENAVVQDDEIATELVNGRSIFKGKYVLVFPADEDLSSLSWDGQDHNTRKKIIQKVNFIFSSNHNTIDWALGKKHATRNDFKAEFKSIKPCIWSSDAHDFVKMFTPDNDRYTWIKADPVFAGLKQVLNEPEERVFIGATPPNYKHDHKVITKISIPKSNGWFIEDFMLELNPGLIAIIGGRGSGKSALAEAIACGAGSKDDNENAFFKKAAKHKNPITDVKIYLEWGDGSKTDFTVGVLVGDQGLVQYLPQGAVEELCSHDNSDKLRKQIENVIYQALDETEKMGTSDFNELKGSVLGYFQYEKEQIVISIRDINNKIYNFSNILKNLPEKKNQLLEKKIELEKLIKSLPNLPPEDKKGQEELSKLLESKKVFESKIIELQSVLTKLHEIEVKIKVFKTKIKEFKDELDTLLLAVDLSESEVFKFSIDESGIETVLESKRIDITKKISTLKNGNKLDVGALLNIPIGLLVFDNFEVLNRGIESKRKETRAFETSKLKYQQQKKTALDLEKAIKVLENEIDKVKHEAAPEIDRLKEERVNLYSSYFELLMKEKTKMTELYEPLQSSLLAGTDTDKKLIFEAQISHRLSSHIKSGLEIIDRTRKGNFRESNSLKKVLNEMAEDFFRGDYGNKIIKKQLYKILHDFTFIDKDNILIEDQLRENKSIEDFDNWLFDPSYFEIISSLQFDGTDLYLLSPGQKGIILLMLYLEIDKTDYRPIIVDQPEENLDNLSVYKDLIEYFRVRKQYRQIIMVTHNPNLVVNTDSEQIIVANYNGKRLPRLEYCSGSLEDQAKVIPNVQIEDFKDGIIEQVCSILEGGETAFESRKRKYQISIKSQIK